MKTTEEILNILREFKHTAGDKYGIEQIALFGSAARGELREDSDIDVCVKPRKAIDLLTLHENMRQLFRQNIERDAIYV